MALSFLFSLLLHGNTLLWISGDQAIPHTSPPCYSYQLMVRPFFIFWRFLNLTYCHLFYATSASWWCQCPNLIWYFQYQGFSDPELLSPIILLSMFLGHLFPWFCHSPYHDLNYISSISSIFSITLSDHHLLYFQHIPSSVPSPTSIWPLQYINDINISLFLTHLGFIPLLIQP